MEIKTMISVVLVVVIAVWMYAGGFTPTGNAVRTTKPSVTMYKSASCGCCVGYAEYLRQNGFDVRIEIVEDMSHIKEKFGIPLNMQSCHTLVVDDYVVEGHVPVEAIHRLLKEKPHIRGITLPGMPSGSPGMPGVKQGEWIVYSLTYSGIKEFGRF